VVEYDPYSEAVLDDPHPVYRALREESPVHYLPKYAAWALSRFEDIWSVSTDALDFSVRSGTSAPQLLSKQMPVFPNLNHLDPPAHTELRKRLWHFFSPRAVIAYEDRLRRFLVARLEELAPQSGCEVMDELAFPVSARVACIAVGFPECDAAQLVSLVQRVFRREDGVEGMAPDAVAAFSEMQDYLQRLARERLARGVAPDNPVNALLTVPEIESAQPALETRASHLMLLLTGSTETFPKTFASALYRLWQYPDQRRELVENPALIPAAFDEVLRFDMPTQFLCRTLLRDVELRGVRMRAGHTVLLLYPSGNRDPREFRDPDRFDIHRRAPRILTFGHGVHRCLGVHFAKLEGRVMLEETLARWPDYQIIESGIRRERTEFVQGFRHLPIQFSG
jgi:cytochrome P450